MASIQQQAEHDAQRVLNTIWGPRRLPIDPVLIAKELGVDAFASGLDENVSAILVKKGLRDPFIILNENDSANRQRFSCAHELGHFVRRTNAGDIGKDFEYIELRGPLAKEGTDEEEIYANAFAANLLMPKAQVQEFVKDKMSVVEMTYLFEVSSEAMQNRLTALSLKADAR